MIARLRARWACHGSLWCCQYVDQPMCNTGADPHLLARLRFRRQARSAARQDGDR